MNDLKISIVTATFNSSATLPYTLESVLSQKYGNIEHIIVDGGSRDSTMDIVREYEPRYNGRLRYVSEKDNGLYDAMNKGISMATGDVIGILNSDDLYFDENVVPEIADAFGDNGIGCVFGDLIFVDSTDIGRVVRTWKGSDYPVKGFFSAWHPAHPTFYARREYFEKYGGFDLDFDVSADFELMFRFMEKYKVKGKYLPRTFVRMRMGGESTGSISKIIEGNKNVLRAFRKNDFTPPRFYLLRRLLPKAINLVKTKFMK